ncbi:MAG: helix-turn-helix domain-containing protein, partial [Anaerolineae bacterium]|nr:helix-turn-helix domain-containing protein [Anaerolineae bacterium]
MIRDMHRKGVSISEIARQTGRDRKTIRKIIQAGSKP